MLRLITPAFLFACLLTPLAFSAPYCEPEAHSERLVDTTQGLSQEDPFDYITATAHFPNGSRLTFGDTTDGLVLEEGGQDVMVKYAADGSIVWHHIFPKGQGIGWVLEAYPSANNGFAILTPSGVSKHDAEGKKVWQAPMPDPGTVSYRLETAVLLDDGSIVAGGSMNEAGLLTKVSATGESLWFKSFPPTQVHSFQNLLLLSDGSILASGRKPSTEHRFGAALMLLTAEGELIWEKNFPAVEEHDIADVLVLPDDSIVAIGTLQLQPPNTGSSDHRMWIIKLDKAGEERWLWHDGSQYLVVGGDASLTDSGQIEAVWSIIHSGLNDAQSIECTYYFNQ